MFSEVCPKTMEKFYTLDNIMLLEQVSFYVSTTLLFGAF